jgi:hypothetical protein
VPAATGAVEGAAAVTVAVNVTDWPNTEGLRDEKLTAVVVFAGLTVCSQLADVEVVKLLSPL